MTYASQANDEALRREAAVVATQAKPVNALGQIMTVLDKGTVAEKQIALGALGNLPGLAADAMFIPWLDRLQTGRLDPALRLDLLEAAAKRNDSGRPNFRYASVAAKRTALVSSRAAWANTFASFKCTSAITPAWRM